MKVISTYSHKQAIEDELLIDVSEMAKEAGIMYPTAVTNAVWSIIAPSSNHKDVEGRLWDTMFMLRHAARSSNKSELLFRVSFSGKVRVLKAVVMPGDNLEPVITVMLPNE